MADISKIKTLDGTTYNIKDTTARNLIPTNISDLTNDSGFITGMEILSYGSSTWNDFITAYNAKKVVYCRASSNANPATGSQTRLAFMTYVNNETNPTNVEFQYYHSVSSHTASQQGDQVYVYKLDKTAGWTITTREASSKIAAGTNMTSSYANGTLTLNATGGGGTSDYDALSNRPSINGTTLSGNKTAAELGLGTYSKPSGGIPKTDLASAVQTSLGLADSALQSVPSTYRTAAAQDAIDAAQDAEIAQIPRPNLLDNWYFVGGGSQNGNGVFPINQREQIAYDLNGTHGFDRWRGTNTKITIKSGSINVKLGNGGSARQRFGQIINLSLHSGEQYTFSALLKVYANTDNTLRFWLSSRDKKIQEFIPEARVSSIFKLYSWTFTVSADYSDIAIEFITNTSSASSLADFDIKAVKLELGSNQTLTHNEGTESNPNWVLNAIPVYSEEFNKCLMYFERIKGPYVGFATGYSTNGTNAYVCGKVNPKVKAPSITLSGRIYLQSTNHAGSNSSMSTSLTSVYALPSGNFSFICQSSNMVQGEFNQAQFRDTTSYLDFSAE